MRVEVTVRQEYSKVTRVFRGWQTAQAWMEETLMADGPDVELVIRKEEPELELPFQDTDFQD